MPSAGFRGQISTAFLDFADWWVEAITGLVPRPVRLLFKRRNPAYNLECRPNGLALSRDKDPTNNPIWTTGVPVTSGDFSRVTRGFRRDVRIFVSPELIIRSRFSVPPLSRRDVYRLLENEVERRTPLRPDQAYFGGRVLDTDRGSNSCEVALAAVRKETVDDACEAAKRLGFRVERVVAAGQDHDFDPDVSIRANRSSERWSRSPKTVVNWLLLFGIVGFVAVNLQTYGARMDARLLDIENDLAAVREAALASAEIKSQIEQSRLREEFLLEKRRLHNALGPLLAVTKSLPDSAWIFSYQASGGDIEFAGFADNASNLLPLLQKSPEFSNARFARPVARTAGIDAEQFHISASFRLRGDQ